MFHHRFFFSQLVIWPSKIRTPAGLRGRVLEHLPCRCRTKVTVGWAKIAAEKNRWLFVPWCKWGDWHRWRRCLRFMWISFVETVAAGRPKSWYIMIYHEFLNHKRSIMHLALSISELSRIRWIEGWKDSNWAKHKTTRRSVSSECFFLWQFALLRVQDTEGSDFELGRSRDLLCCWWLLRWCVLM